MKYFDPVESCPPARHTSERTLCCELAAALGAEGKEKGVGRKAQQGPLRSQWQIISGNI